MSGMTLEGLPTTIPAGVSATGPITEQDATGIARFFGGIGNNARAVLEGDNGKDLRRELETGERGIIVFSLPRIFKTGAFEKAIAQARRDKRIEIVQVHRPRPDKVLITFEVKQNPLPYFVVVGIFLVTLAILSIVFVKAFGVSVTLPLVRGARDLTDLAEESRGTVTALVIGAIVVGLLLWLPRPRRG